MTTLDLGVVGNCAIAALIDARARVVWHCLPRFDGDPVFCDLLRGHGRRRSDASGVYEIEIDDFVRSEQEYLTNTAILITRLYDGNGGVVEIEDFAPRFEQFGRIFRPLTLVRGVRPITGAPRIRIRLRPSSDYGADAPVITHGSNHVRYVGANATMRLTTDAPPAYVLDETPFFLEEPVTLVLGPDETLSEGPATIFSRFRERTRDYWREWVRRLAIPLDWQDAVIRSAITLKLCSFEETGAIVAALTTSVPEYPDSGRNWDYRYCWLRDAYFVVRALNRLGAVPVLENYVRFLTNIVATANGGDIQPVYGIALERRLHERTVDGVAGYRGMGPVRVGNQAFEQRQHDVYGDIVLATTQAFFDSRFLKPGDERTFARLEGVGRQAVRLAAKPDAGMWELRDRTTVHTSSSLMCWAACDRLAKVARHLGLGPRWRYWRRKAAEIRETILEEAWNPRLGTFVASFGGKDIDASLLLMPEVGFIDPNDRRFRRTLKTVEQELRRGNHLMRYATSDDFGEPVNSFIICTFWYVECLAASGRNEEAREIYEDVLSHGNHLGLLSEDLDVETGELWGNFPQTYSLVGQINSAIRLSRSWEEVL